MSFPKPHKLTPEERKRGQRNGGTARAQSLSYQQRVLISTIGNVVKSAKMAGWNPYDRNPSDVAQVNERLHKLVALEAQAWTEKDWERVARMIDRQLACIKLRMWITAASGYPGRPPMEIERTEEDQNRLANARRRRRMATAEVSEDGSNSETEAVTNNGTDSISGDGPTDPAGTVGEATGGGPAEMGGGDDTSAERERED